VGNTVVTGMGWEVGDLVGRRDGCLADGVGDNVTVRLALIDGDCVDDRFADDGACVGLRLAFIDGGSVVVRFVDVGETVAVCSVDVGARVGLRLAFIDGGSVVVRFVDVGETVAVRFVDVGETVPVRFVDVGETVPIRFDLDEGDNDGAPAGTQPLLFLFKTSPAGH
jgi:hypothetical protein